MSRISAKVIFCGRKLLSAIWVSDCKFIDESAPLAVVYEIGKTNNAYMYVLASLVAAFLGIVCFTAAIRSLRSGMLVGRVSRIYRTRQPLGFFVGVVALFFSGTIPVSYTHLTLPTTERV